MLLAHRDSWREVLRDVLVLAALLALALLLTGCESVAAWANAPTGPEPGAPTQGEAVVSAAASGLALVNPLAAVGALFGGRLLLGALKRR